MKNENILTDIKSKSLKEARAEIDAILSKLESRETDLNESICDYQRLIELNPFEELELNAKFLLNGIKEGMIQKGIPFVSNQIGGMFGFFFAEQQPRNFEDVVETNDKNFEQFFKQSLDQGIYFAPSKFEAGFISTKHSESVLKNVLSKIQAL